MKTRYCSLLILHSSLLMVAAGETSAQTSRDYPYQPVKFSDVTVNDNFWSGRIETNRTVTIPFAFKKCETTGRLKNFEVAGEVNAGEIKTGKFCSAYGYDDSDVYKIIEGASYSLTTHYDKNLDTYLDSLIAHIAAAQEKDGYLYTMRTINPDKSWATQRWVNDRTRSSHELYNAGHMYEAAVAHFYATGKRTLLDVAIKNADLLCKTFGPDKNHTVPGHQEVEIGLAKLYRVTGDKKYLDLAKFFLDERGKGDVKGGEYNQDYKPVIDQEEAVGHAVRAGYMYSAMADIAALTGDESYIRAIDRIWENVVTKKIYITGGVGAISATEAYGKNYELPNLTAYNETCAAIANVYWNYRMFLLHGDGKYFDVLERTLYNGLISGVSLDGTTFFYPNPLESTGDYSRSEWFDCSCCPSNITRFISSVSGYIYATKHDTLFVNLFIGGKGKIDLEGRKLEVTQETNYPWDGNVKIHIEPEKEGSFSLKVRIPGWAMNRPLPGDLYSFTDLTGATMEVKLNGKPVNYGISRGYATITGKWKKGDIIDVSFPMPVRKIFANAMVADDKNKLCLSRGPIVYCAEGKDNNGLADPVVLPDQSQFAATFNADLLKGIEVLTGNVIDLKGDGYEKPVTKESANLTLIPYYAWCHRGEGRMQVWFDDQRKIFPPLADPPSSLFLASIDVKLKRYQDQDVFLMTNSKGQVNSGTYTGQFTLSETTEITAFGRDKKGTRSEVVREKYTKVEPTPPVVVTGPKPGLGYAYYKVKWRKFGDYTTVNPKKSGSSALPDPFSVKDTTDYYSVVFTGYIKIPATGVYTFITNSDDGSRIRIDEILVVDNDGIHGEQEATGQAALQTGLHKFRLDYFQYNGGEKMEVFVKGPGLGKTLVPASWYVH
jgi:uncharacterized protein